MERQTETYRRAIGGRQEQAVAAKVVEADTVAPQPFEQQAETAHGKQLSRQQMMALHARLISGIGQAVYDAERQAAADRPHPRHGRCLR
jgi:hypothetical protein